LIGEILDEDFKKGELKGRVLKQLIPYAEYQFGTRVPLRGYREREDGETIDNWTVEIEMLITIHKTLADCHFSDESLSMVSRSDLRFSMRFSLYKKMLDLLRPWSAVLDSISTATTNRMTEDQVNVMLFLSAIVENEIATIHMHRNQDNIAEAYCQRGLSYARLYEGTEDKKADLLCGGLRTFSRLRVSEENYADALTFAEEAYNCSAVAYNPVHPKVQDAASMLIECLRYKGDFCKAELFAQMTLDSLKDPKNGLDQQSEAVARGYYDLANVITKQRGDMLKAEMLARESLRIRVIIDSNGPLLGVSVVLLASVLRIQNKLGSETKELYEQSLANSIRNYGPDGENTANVHIIFGIYYRDLADKQQIGGEKKKHLRLSEIKIKEAVRIFTKIYGPDDLWTVRYSTELSTVIRLLSEV
jgi:hypothetical protein